MLNSDDITALMLEVITHLGIRQDELWVGAGSAMCLADSSLRKETADVDTGCLPELYDRIAKSSLVTDSHIDKRYSEYPIVTLLDYVDVHREEEKPDDLVSTGSVTYASMESVLEFKRGLNRSKDQRDIRALEVYIALKGRI